jgi:hypothetical protein
MLKKAKKVGVCLFLALTFALLKTGVCPAQITLRVDKPRVKLAVSPGEAKSGTISVENPSHYPLTIKTYLEDWEYSPGGEGVKTFALAGTHSRSGALWISYSPAEFTIPPYGRKKVNYTVNVPNDAKGGYYAILFFETQLGEKQNAEGLSVAVMGRVGTLFYIEAEGTQIRRAELRDLKITRKNKAEPLKINAVFKNTGNTQLKARGTFDVINDKGMVFARGSFNEIYTMPGGEEAIQADWYEDIPPGEYDLIITLDTGGTPLIEEHRIKIAENGKLLSVN